MIVGNLTRDPEMHTTQAGQNVCDFTVAVNRRRTNNNSQPEADFFRVSAWNQLGENCQRYLAKGRKVLVIGPVSARTYQANDGTTRVSQEVMATEVEFLSPRQDEQAGGYQNGGYQNSGYQQGYSQPQGRYQSQSGYQNPAPPPQYQNQQPASAPVPESNGFQQMQMDEDDLPF